MKVTRTDELTNMCEIRWEWQVFEICRQTKFLGKLTKALTKTPKPNQYFFTCLNRTQIYSQPLHLKHWTVTLPCSTESVTQLFNKTFTLAIFLNKWHQKSETIKQQMLYQCSPSRCVWLPDCAELPACRRHRSARAPVVTQLHLCERYHKHTVWRSCIRCRRTTTLEQSASRCPSDRRHSWNFLPEVEDVFV